MRDWLEKWLNKACIGVAVLAAVVGVIVTLLRDSAPPSEPRPTAAATPTAATAPPGAAAVKNPTPAAADVSAAPRPSPPAKPAASTPPPPSRREPASHVQGDADRIVVWERKGVELRRREKPVRSPRWSQDLGEYKTTTEWLTALQEGKAEIKYKVPSEIVASDDPDWAP